MEPIEKEIVFIKFTSHISKVDSVFVGTREGILEDTLDGTFFGGDIFKSYNEISYDQARQLRPVYFDVGLNQVKTGICKSFLL